MSSNRLKFLYFIPVRKLLSLRLDECSGSLAFRRYIVRSLMHSVNPSAPQAGPRPRPLDEVRKNGLNHHLSRNDKQARRRLCMKNCRMKCTKCDVPLHIHCELDYHTQDAWCEHLLLWHHLAINFLVIAQFIILRMCLYICIHSSQDLSFSLFF